jgi:NAD(P)-dependent dehydrogenase (short-subunit alcohol dehydrogenase family)
MELGLKGKVALITGAGSQIGFGKAIALQLAKEGCDVVINDIDLDGAKQTAAEVEKLGQKSLAIKADVTTAAAWEAMVKQVLDEFGRIDILVNNAGGSSQFKPFIQTTDEDWDFDMNVNLSSTRYGMKTVLPHMYRQKSGKVINITSGAGITGGMGLPGYAAAKAGIIALTLGVCREAAPEGVNINCVSPGPADTGFAKNAPPGMLENFPKTLPIGRLTTAQDVANAVTFLVSDAASDIVGQILIVSGGPNP